MKILLVTPEADGSDFAGFLREAGHEVAAADCALFATDYVNLDDFDAVVVDEALPRGTGFQLVSRIKLHNLVRGGANPIVMLVGSYEASDRAIFHGADSCFLKSSPDQLRLGSGASATRWGQATMQ